MATLYLVSTPIGNLGDLTRRGAETLGSVARVLAEDTRRTRVLLDHLGLDTPLVSLHEHNEAAREEAVLGWLDAGEELALVSDAGAPLVSDPGGRIVPAVLEAGHAVVPIPGPSAVLAALTASGLPADTFSFLGFVPRKGKERQAVLDKIAASLDTTVLFESPERLTALLEALEGPCGGDRRVAVGRELTKIHEEFVRGGLREVLDHFRRHPPRGEITVVVAGAPCTERGLEASLKEARALALELLGQGMPPSGIAREVARRLDLPRNQLYDLVHEWCREAEERIPDRGSRE